MLNIAICDDEKYFRNEIRGILEKYLSAEGIVCSIDDFASGEELTDLGIEMQKYDIVFLDINMDQMDGIDAARKIREKSKDIFIVFVTAYIDYTIEGYKVDAFRYILKNNNMLEGSIGECLDSIRDRMAYEVEQKEFEFSEGRKTVSLERILFVESNLHRLIFHIMEDSLKQYTVYKTLDEMEKELEGKGFIRIHQSYLVNIQHVNSISRYYLILDNGIRLSIPRARYNDVQKLIAEYKGAI
ncbi:MAG: LytTR family DNA-binding domain-containing protein [Lachnospiraceae bacterium]|nr:LytTR family DNA-binding domain-containing protein [Lachnospiraceae bacterium]